MEGAGEFTRHPAPMSRQPLTDEERKARRSESRRAWKEREKKAREARDPAYAEKRARLARLREEYGVRRLTDSPAYTRLKAKQWAANQQPGVLAAKHRAWRTANPLLVKINQKRALERFNERYQADDEFRARNNARCNAWGRNNYLRLNARFLLNGARHRAKKKGLEFNLVIDDIVIPEFCPVLGLRLEPRTGGRGDGRGPGPASPTLDRIDNSLGYVRGNVVVISWRANRLKGDATLEEMRRLLEYLEGAALPSLLSLAG